MAVRKVLSMGGAPPLSQVAQKGAAAAESAAAERRRLAFSISKDSADSEEAVCVVGGLGLGLGGG